MSITSYAGQSLYFYNLHDSGSINNTVVAQIETNALPMDELGDCTFVFGSDPRPSMGGEVSEDNMHLVDLGTASAGILPNTPFSIDTSDFDDKTIVCFGMPNFDTNYYETPRNQFQLLTKDDDSDILFIDSIPNPPVSMSSESMLNKYVNLGYTQIYRYIIPYRLFDQNGVIIPYDVKPEDTSSNNGDTSDSISTTNWWIIVVVLLIIMVIVIISIIFYLLKRKKRST